MNNSITIIIPGEPQSKERARKGKQGHWYNPQSDIMGIAARIIKQNLPAGFPIGKYIPVKCDISAFFKPPKDKKNGLFVNDDVPCLNQNDVDNIFKFYSDTMNKLVYNDDNQIYSGTIEKYYSLNPRTEITISWGKFLN